MSLLQRGLMFVLAAGTLAIPSSVPPETRAGGRAAVTVDPQTVSVYTPTDKEFYLTESQVDFIRPGLKVTIGHRHRHGARQEAERRADDDGRPEPAARPAGRHHPGRRRGALRPGDLRRRLELLHEPPRRHERQPDARQHGDVGDLGGGKYKYTFAATLPTFDVNKPMTLFAGASRNMVDYLGKTYYVTAFKDFVPATGAAAQTWNVMGLAKCNACHDPLARPRRQLPRHQDLRPLPQRQRHEGANLAEFDMGFWHRIHSRNLEAIGEITYPQAYLNNCEACHDPKATQGTVYHDEALPRRLRQLPCRRQFRDGRGPQRGQHRADRRLEVRRVPPARQRPGVRRLHHGRARPHLRVQAAQGPEGRDRLGHQDGPRPEPGRHLQADRERRQGPRPEALRHERQHPRRAARRPTTRTGRTSARAPPPRRSTGRSPSTR